jgi:hypothetical protein
MGRIANETYAPKGLDIKKDAIAFTSQRYRWVSFPIDGVDLDHA